MHADHASFGPIVVSVSLSTVWHMHFRPRRARPHARHALPSDEFAELPRRSDTTHGLPGHSRESDGGVPCDVLPGGKQRDRGRLFKAISRADPGTLAAKLAGYRDEGYTRFQMKVGDDPDRDIDRIRRVAKEGRAGDIPVADANTSRKQHEAMRVAAAVRNQTRVLTAEE